VPSIRAVKRIEARVPCPFSGDSGANKVIAKSIVPAAFLCRRSVLSRELRREHPGWGPRRIEHQLGRIGVEPVPFVCNGGLDANWMTAHGIPTVTLGCGQLFQHMVREQLDVSAFHDACRIALRLATDTEPKAHSA